MVRLERKIMYMGFFFLVYFNVILNEITNNNIASNIIYLNKTNKPLLLKISLIPPPLMKGSIFFKNSYLS